MALRSLRRTTRGSSPPISACFAINDNERLQHRVIGALAYPICSQRKISFIHLRRGDGTVCHQIAYRRSKAMRFVPSQGPADRKMRRPTSIQSASPYAWPPVLLSFYLVLASAAKRSRAAKCTSGRDCFVALSNLNEKAGITTAHMNASLAKAQGPPLSGTSRRWMGPGFRRDSGLRRLSSMADPLPVGAGACNDYGKIIGTPSARQNRSCRSG